jgi:hypothetical protein
LKRSAFKTPLFLIKIFNFEYWPYWIFYIPTVPYMLWLSWRARSFTFYTSVNPSIPLGGIVGESKIHILKNIDQHYIPKTIFIDENSSFDEVLNQVKEKQLSYPLIAKPDHGERGTDVEKLTSENDLHRYHSKIKEPFLIQQFIPYDLELGILYYRLPDGSGSGITSVVKKGFMEIEGDGESTILQLLEANTRARFVLDELKLKLGDQAHNVLYEGEKFYPQPIGNHCKGTKFINANHLVNSELINTFDKIASSMDEFYYGRFDLRVKNMDDLYKGENIFIMEVNGVTSEPGHIYDPEMKLVKAYRDMFKHMKLLYTIGKMNKERGFAYSTWTELTSTIKRFKK